MATETEALAESAERAVWVAPAEPAESAVSLPGLLPGSVPPGSLPPGPVSAGFWSTGAPAAGGPVGGLALSGGRRLRIRNVGWPGRLRLRIRSVGRPGLGLRGLRGGIGRL